MNGHSCPKLDLQNDLINYRKIMRQLPILGIPEGGQSLADVNPELAKQWHPDKNGDLKPYDVLPGSNKNVWWQCPVDDEHEWKTSVAHRSNRGHGCPYCSGRRATKQTSLVALYPDLAMEWHPTKNKNLTPDEVTAMSGKKVWWQCPKNNEHEWEAMINNRTKKGSGCPICTNKKAVISNSLAVNNPELAKEWDPTKNGALTPYDVTPGSAKKVWWKCPRGKDHEWKTSVALRNKGTGCPKCASQTSGPELRIYCELKTIFEPIENRFMYGGYEIDIFLPEIDFGIEYDGEYWHRKKHQIDLEKNEALEDKIFLLRVREKGLEKIRETDISLRKRDISIGTIKEMLKVILSVRDIESPVISKKINDYLNRKQWIARKEYKKLQFERNQIDYEGSIAYLYPKLSEEWHYEKNYPMLPDFYLPGSNKVVWWKCSKGDDHVWKAPIERRVKGVGCPVCSGKKVVASNSLSALYPELAKEWHPTKNIEITPNDVVPGSNKKVWWQCSKGDDHVWKAQVADRAGGHGCPMCSNKIVVKSNCLETLNPHLASEWHSTKNGQLTPRDVTLGSNKVVWWKCAKGSDHEWEAAIFSRQKGMGCPICSNQTAVTSNCLATLNPELAKQWHPTKNKELTPYDVVPGSGKKVWWLGKCGHEWLQSIRNRTKKGQGCPKCSRMKGSRIRRAKSAKGQLKLL